MIPGVESKPEPPPDPGGFRMDRCEIAGSLGDLGTLVPIAVLLVTVNGLNPTVVFGVVGLTYVLAGLYYRIPMSVQPLKSFSSLAIALGLGAPVIGAGAAVMGAVLLVLGLTGAAGWLARAVPRPLVRGIQLGVGIILVRVGTGLSVGLQGGLPVWAAPALAGGTAVVVALLIDSRRFPAGVVAIAGGLFVGILLFGAPAVAWGPVVPEWHPPSAGDLWQGATLLVLPQLPLTLTNSISATQETARHCFGEGARRVTGRALAVGLGAANLVAGLAGGMPVCHGSGGITAHHRFGARTGGAGVFIGGLLLLLGLLFGPAIAGFCKTIPSPVLGALMVYVGAAHCLLIRDVQGGWAWVTVLATGGVGGGMSHNGFGLAAGVLVSGLGWLCRPRTATGNASGSGPTTP